MTAVVSRRALVLALLIGFLTGAVLTALFCAWELMVDIATGGKAIASVDLWPHALHYAMHWTIWALLAPVLLLLVRRYPIEPGRWFVRAIAWIPIGLAVSIGQAVCAVAIAHVVGVQILVPQVQGPLRHQIVIGILQYGLPNILTFGLVAGALHASVYYLDLRDRRIAQADLEARVARAELDALRIQLQPHFFFNALHTVSALMQKDVLSARRVLVALGDLLRLSIDHLSRPEIPLREELEFVARYVDIQRARYRNRLIVHMDVPEDVGDGLVPSLLLQPLVENAIRHGIEPYTRSGQVWITGQRRGSDLALEVYDDGPSGATPRITRNGVGLANLSARLEHLYGSQHAFSAARDDGGGFRVAITLPFRTS